MKTILVTGGAGFVGSHTVERLLADGYRVVVADNLSTGVRANVPTAAELRVIDINSPEFPDLVREVEPETIVHLAAQVSVAASLKTPVVDANENIGGTLRVLEAARECNVQNFVFSSSAAVYGVPESLPLREDMRPNPVNPYGVAKTAAEAYIRTYCMLYGMKAIIMRFSNVFGPRQRADGDGGVVAKFLDAITRGIRPVFYGDGSQTRDFIYVKDVAEAIIKALKYFRDANASECLTINISSSRETSLRDLYALFQEMFGQVPEPVIAPPRRGDIQRSCLDNRKAVECLGWAPRYSLEQGIRDIVSSQGEHYAHGSQGMTRT